MSLAMVIFVPLNDRGARIGQHHPRAKLFDCDVDLIRELHEEWGLSYEQISYKFGIPKTTVKNYCRYTRRAQTAYRYRKLVILP